MLNFLKMKYFDIEKRTGKDGFLDIKESTNNIKNNVKTFFTILLFFISISLLKDILLANMSNIDFKTQSSLMLDAKPDYSFVFYIFGIFLSFFIYFFTIDAYRDLNNFSFTKSIGFGLVKFFDYRNYVLGFSILIFTIISIRIATIPIVNALPDISSEQFVKFISDFFKVLQRLEINESIQYMLNDQTNKNIIEGLNSISKLNIVVSLFSGILFFIIICLFHFIMFFNIVLFHSMTFFEAIKASFILNFKNAFYLTNLSFSIIGLSIVIFVINSFIFNQYLSVLLNSTISAYSIYLITWVIIRNTKEKK